MEILVKPEMLTSYIYGPTFDNAETLAGKVFTHKCDTGKLSALIQC